MAKYGTLKYYEEKVKKAEAKVELMSFAIVRTLGSMSGTSEEAAKINAMCESYTEAYQELEDNRREYNECLANETGHKEGA